MEFMNYVRGLIVQEIGSQVTSPVWATRAVSVARLKASLPGKKPRTKQGYFLTVPYQFYECKKANAKQANDG
jgi:hypothetical protein